MKKINESFECINCHHTISPAERTCRNHCPYCFASLHVDKSIPGDRKSTCHGIMFPKSYEHRNGVTKILFQCTQCDHRHRNKRAQNDEMENIDTLINEYKKQFI